MPYCVTIGVATGVRKTCSSNSLALRICIISNIEIRMFVRVDSLQILPGVLLNRRNIEAFSSVDVDPCVANFNGGLVHTCDASEQGSNSLDFNWNLTGINQGGNDLISVGFAYFANYKRAFKRACRN